MLGRLTDRIKVPTWVVICVWVYSIWRCFKSGYAQAAVGLAKDYIRPIKF